MKEKSGAVVHWIVFSVLSVLVPVVIAFILTSIINEKHIKSSDVMSNIILVSFSLACSLLSICWEVYNQKHSKFTVTCFCVSGFFMFISWTSYVFSLSYSSAADYADIICLASLVIVITCSILGALLGKASSKNEKEIIKQMHQNCEKIRGRLMETKYNNKLKPYTLHSTDLLCDPSNMDRVDCAITNILEGNEDNE